MVCSTSELSSAVWWMPRALLGGRRAEMYWAFSRARSASMALRSMVRTLSTAGRRDQFARACLGSFRGVSHWSLELTKEEKMVLLVVAILVILALFGAGFALHVLWWVAIAALVLAVIGFFARRA